MVLASRFAGNSARTVPGWAAGQITDV
jgi:hypothetical protein